MNRRARVHGHCDNEYGGRSETHGPEAMGQYNGFTSSGQPFFPS